MKLHISSSRRHASQRGVTLIEALVALVIMSFGMVALVGLLSNLRYGGDVAKQRSEAMNLAQTELEKLRSYAVLKRATGTTVQDYETDLLGAVQPTTSTGENSNTTFTLTRTVKPLLRGVTLASGDVEPQALRAQTVSVRVDWRDRSGTPQSVTMNTIISRADPVFTLAVGVTPPSNGVRLAGNRHPAIPPRAQDLGNGSSAFRPPNGGTAVWVFNNLTGVITGKCEIGETTTLSASAVDSCKNNTVGYLISGSIRFSNADTPDPARPEATALPYPLTAYLNLTPSQFKVRDSEGAYSLAPGGDYRESPNHVCFSDAPEPGLTTRTAVNYYCIVFPNTQTPRNWWGQLLLTGLDLGTSATQHKVCRYSADYNGNGYTYVPATREDELDKIDNEEHPATYQRVTYSLARQNFLVVRGDVSCPTAPAPDPANGIFLNYSTVQIQP
ncbi:prepilin-type N-terminal cleavage/methylation domain-containing protein [Roseateles sp. DXS20W]|uniref:Prepilin-type N-terminal cleavage/methylation domain-containing protein n=2 Tax=Pelomonas lactea TaxID=3299030 RepID=A0ABW7GGS6_9BURK